MQYTAQPGTDREDDAAFTPRQGAVLEKALGLLVEGGDRALTTARIARAASCSKETLYKWFGDRDGLLAAVIAYQAGKVRAPAPGEVPDTIKAFQSQLVSFAHDLLSVLSGDVSLALNRLAIGQASGEDAKLGRLVLDRGRNAIGRRAGQLLEAGRQRGFIQYADRDEAFRTLYGLIVSDLHVRLLLGDRPNRGKDDYTAQARKSVDQFFALYGAVGRAPVKNSTACGPATTAKNRSDRRQKGKRHKERQ
ncbi:MAG: TetR/AcrR family transcriptional regulator [Pseudomonadota bacterium]